MKTGVLLINLGTPDAPSTGAVRRYLSEFLNDPRVIDIHPIARAILVNLFIVPFRAPKSAKLYQKIWTKEGSPLLLHSLAFLTKLRIKLGDDFELEFAMRYQKPSLDEALARLYKKNVTKLIILPLYPQYASSSTGSTMQKVNEIIGKWPTMPDITYINSFYNHKGFIDAIEDRAKQSDVNSYDHILFSFHGLPERQITKCGFNGKCLTNGCCEKITTDNHQCYKASCYETARLIAARLNLKTNKYTVSFQSRLGKDPWIKPYSDHVLKELAHKGVKKVLAFSPAFVADCLETVYEIAVEYNELFKEKGVTRVTLVESLNSSDKWVNFVEELIKKHS